MGFNSGFKGLLAVNVRLAEGGEVTLQMAAGGPSEISADTYTALVSKDSTVY